MAVDQAKFFPSNYSNRVVHPFTVFFKNVSLICVKTRDTSFSLSVLLVKTNLYFFLKHLSGPDA